MEDTTELVALRQRLIQRAKDAQFMLDKLTVEEMLEHPEAVITLNQLETAAFYLSRELTGVAGRRRESEKLGGLHVSG